MPSRRLEAPPGATGQVLDYMVAAGKARLKGRPLSENFVPQTHDELWEFVRSKYGIEIPRYAVCEDHDAPFEAFANAYFAYDERNQRDEPMAMWLGSRGLSGKTYLASLLSFIEETTLGASVNMLGGSYEQATIAHGYTRDLWYRENAPRHLLIGDPTARETRLTNGGHERVLTASPRSVRGWHPQRLRIDEADEVKLAILDAALGQPMSREESETTGRPGVASHVLYTSTHHYPHGTVTELKKRAAEQGWRVYQWCYRESQRRVVDGRQVGWLPEAEIERKRASIPAAMWVVEYDLQAPALDGRAISSVAVDLAFGQRELGHYEGNSHEVIETVCCSSGRQRWLEAVEELREEPVYAELRPEERARWVRAQVLHLWWPCHTHAYATGIDWGKLRDWTVITTYRTDVDPWWLVAWERTQHLDWNLIVDKASVRITRYPGPAAHDVGGLGTVTNDLLRVPARAVGLTGRERSGAFNSYILAIERGRLLHPRIDALWYDHAYVTTKDLYTQAGHPPDSFIAGALAWYVRDRWSDADTAPGSVEGGGYFDPGAFDSLSR